MQQTLKPETPQQLCEAIGWAAGERQPLEVVGHASKRAIGRPVQAATTLDLSAFSGISLYEPEELVITAGAATPLAEVSTVLAEKNQCLAFEPPDLTGLVGGNGTGTLGGLIAANLSGPRRIRAGAARDHFLGFKAVSGRGEGFKSGGRVVKNVTGYDLAKLMAGSWGTLAAMHQVTLKVLPAPADECTVVIAGLEDAMGIRVLSLALGSSADVSGAAHLPAAVADGGEAMTCIRLEGVSVSVKERAAGLKRLVQEFGPTRMLARKASRKLWRSIGAVGPLAGGDDRLVWRVSVPPMDGAGVVATIAAATSARWYYDWGGGLIWLEVPVSEHASAQVIRGAIASTSGHATLIKAPHDIRAGLAVFDPLPDGLRALSRRIKAGFDPHDILNPGRMYA